MRTKVGLAILAASVALALAVSCATPPKTVAAPASEPAKAPPAQAESPPAAEKEPAVAAPDELRSRAADLRKKAFDLGIKAILPEDYSAAEAAFAAGNAGYGTDNAAAATAFGDAAARYQDIISRGLPILASGERARADKLRDVAIGKGAGDRFPELFAFAEEKLAKPAALEASGDFEAAIGGFRSSARDYEVLYKLCDAKSARDAIAARDFAKWDPSNWTIAESRYGAAKDLLRTDAGGAAGLVDEAILRYGIAMRNALEYYASDRQKDSAAERERAIGIKAEVAVKDEFAAAQDLAAKADTAQEAKDFDSSSTLYNQAAGAFASAYAHAKDKMDAAKDELESLDEAIAAKTAAAGAAR